MPLDHLPARRDHEDDGVLTDHKDVSDPLAEPAARSLGLLENIVYAITGLTLVAGAAIVLIAAAYGLFADLDQGAQQSVANALNGLLLVFILLELLAGLRATMAERKLVAEPFLVAGIIGSIKEIIVSALKLDEARAGPEGALEDLLIEIAVLTGVVVALSVATLLVRRKEREPEE